VSELSPSSKIVRTEDAVWREIDGKMVVIALESGRIRTLNATAAAVWKALDGRTLAEICSVVEAEFPDEPAARILADVNAFVADLLSRGMIRVVASPE
jgi:hypothetical protein